jgi:hypothetical protein
VGAWETNRQYSVTVTIKKHNYEFWKFHYSVKNVSDFPVPSRDVTYQTLPAWLGIIKLFPARESLVSDIPAGDGKIANIFYSVVK